MPAHVQPRARQPQAAPGSARAPHDAGSSASGDDLPAHVRRTPQPGVLLRENSLYAVADAWRRASRARSREVFASVVVSIAAPSSRRGGAAGAFGAGAKARLAALPGDRTRLQPPAHPPAAARRLVPLLELLLWVPSVCLALMAAGAVGRRSLLCTSSLWVPLWPGTMLARCYAGRGVMAS
jgi:hypothetical protein